MYALRARVQNYAWGKVGHASAVAQLKALQPGSTVDPEKPYAEYWFGTHPNGPADIVVGDTEQPLQAWLASHQEVCGPAATEDGSLPFLFKVLSVAKALSIQAHPAKDHAAKLHAERPEIYKDPNHKPEMACALTDFEAMCGFRSPSEIAGYLRSVPELRAMVGEEVAVAFEAAVAATDAPAAGDESKTDDTSRTVPAEVRTALQALFTSVMKCDTAKKHAEALAARLGAAAELETPHDVAFRLTKQYPGDVGVIAPYLLNTIVLKPGQAIFLAANEPHAYLDGDCVEIMACSDNVVRAGLTPKLRDVPTLCSMLTYTAGPAAVLTGDVATTTDAGSSVRTYTVPVPEFEMERVVVKPGDSLELPAAPSACILLVLQGQATASVVCADSTSTASLAAGGVFLQDARASVTLASAADATEDLVLFRVHTNSAASS